MRPQELRTGSCTILICEDLERMLLAVTVCLSVTLLFHFASANVPSDERLIGWKGETFDPDIMYDPLNLTASLGPSKIPLPASASWVEHLR